MIFFCRYYLPTFIKILFVSLGFLACEEQPANLSPINATNGLLVVGTDTSFSSSNIYHLDLDSEKNNELNLVLPGQSGDFVLKSDSGKLFGFNRKADNLNFREITIENTEFSFGQQTALPAELVSDPQKMLWLDERNILILGFNSHDVHIVDSNDGSIVTSLEADLDIPGGGPFFPEDIIRLDDNRFAVLHQGHSADFKSTAPGLIIEILWADGKLSAIDTDPDNAKIQGHELTSHLAPRLLDLGDGTYLAPGLCSSWSTGCVAKLEIFDPSSLTISPVDFPELENLKSYGLIIGTGSKKVYAQVEKPLANPDGEEKTEVILAEIEFEQDNIVELFVYTDTNGDNFADTGLLNYDPASSTLYAGEPTNDKEGQIRIYVDNVEKEIVPTQEIPREAVFITDSGFEN